MEQRPLLPSATRQNLATTAGSIPRKDSSGSDNEYGEDKDSTPTELFYTARGELGRSGDQVVMMMSQLMEKFEELSQDVAKLKAGKGIQRQTSPDVPNVDGSESESEQKVHSPPRNEPSRPRKKESWEKDLPRLTKVLKTKEMNPKDEKEFEDVVEEWEMRCKGCGMEDDVLNHLLMHLGSPAVTVAIKPLEVTKMTWNELKDEVARSLFPFSDYVRELEKEMEEEDRSQPISAAVVQLTRLSERHKVLCRRWQRRKTFYDDRLKEALLLKVPQNKISACLSIPDFNTISFRKFVRHCQMVLAAAAAEDKSAAKKKEKTQEKAAAATAVAAVEVAAVESSSSSSSTARQIPPDHKCPNCGLHGHYLRDCPHPRVKCDVCGRSGHRKEVCFKAQKETPNGKTRTSYLRMTRSGIHIDLIDEATKKSLFEAMRRHLEGQETQYAKAKERAAVRRAERKRSQPGAGKSAEETGSSKGDEEGVAAAVKEDELPEISEVSSTEKGDARGAGTTKYVDVEIYQKKVPGLLDSGAVVSLLPEVVWNQIPPEERDLLTTTKVGSRPISGLGGKLEVKEIVDVPIAVARRGLLQRFFVSPAAGTIILGMDALKGLGLRMDFQTGQVLFNGDSEPVPESAMVGVSPLCVSSVKDPQEGGRPKRGKGCTEEEAMKANELLMKYPEIWREPEVGACRLTSHHIDTADSQPVTVRARRLPPEKLKELQRQLKELQESGAIQRSESPWASAVVMVPKSNGKVRLCVDYRRLNAVTQRDLYPLPRITELLDKLGTAQVFSTLDLTAGFHQILLDPESRPKTAFITPEGLYEFRVLPFGLTNAPSTFQRAMDRLFQNHPAAENEGVYMDDIVVYTPTPEDHVGVLEQVCARLKEAKLFVNLDKTVVFAREVKYLGFIVGHGEIKPDPEQIQALASLKPPSDVTGVRRFLGLAGYFRRFIPFFSEKALPLTHLLKKGASFAWTDSCRTAWEKLREELGGSTVRLRLPLPNRIFTLDTDASDKALGAVLMQESEGKDLQPISYASRTLTAPETRWTTREKEAFAIVWGILHYAQYLRWQPHFIVRTDHQSLRWLWRSENRRIIRWALMLQEYSFSIEYNKGSQHAHVDIFSRDVPLDTQEDAFTDRIAMKPTVFALADAPLDRTTRFPSAEEILEAQVSECTDMVVKEHKLRKGTQGFWQTQGGQIYVPARYRRAIMFYFHFGKLGVHQGINKAHARIRRTFWRPGLRNELQEYHNHCLTCARRRPHPLVKGRGHLLASHVGAVVAVDVVGPLDTDGGAVHLLTNIDHFSKYAHAAPLEEVSSAKIWEVLRGSPTWGPHPTSSRTMQPSFEAGSSKSKSKNMGSSGFSPSPTTPRGTASLRHFTST